MNERMEQQRNIFAQVFRMANVLQVYLDNMLKEDQLTAKQMLLMIVVGSFGNASPTFKEAAERSGSSYQNVKQLALKLESNGYLIITSDEKDKRAKRLQLTGQAMAYWSNRDDQDIASMDMLFKSFSLDELAHFNDYILRLQDAIHKLEKE